MTKNTIWASGRLNLNQDLFFLFKESKWGQACCLDPDNINEKIRLSL